MTAHFVLLVDDQPDAIEQRAVAGGLDALGIECAVVHPEDVDGELLARATVVAVDQYLDEWTERQARPLSCRPADGLSLVSVLRGQQQTLSDGLAAFVIRTGRLDALADGLPPTAGEHLIAAQRDIDWVLPKAEVAGEPNNVQRLAALAAAVGRLRELSWSDDGLDHVLDWLRAPTDISWFALAAEDVETCRPPVHLLANRSRGGSILRWFLQRILPYPTFLIDTYRLSVILGSEFSSVQALLNESNPLSDDLSAARYGGPLSEFLGPRWWRSGVDDVARRLGGGNAADPIAVHRTAHEIAPTLAPLDLRFPVPTINSQLLPDEPADIADAVRVVPDLWPAWADQAWARRDQLDDAELAEMVISDDAELDDTDTHA